jgi:hypothetical protein
MLPKLRLKAVYNFVHLYFAQENMRNKFYKKQEFLLSTLDL